jgi:negative regulator of flagellin synthesis FlgM
MNEAGEVSEVNIQNDLQNLQQILGAGRASESGKQPVEQSANEISSPTDEAHLSPAASLVAQAAVLPDVRMDKVASVQAALADGSYQVSSSNVAARLIDQMQLNQK